jgi:uncharacterized protein
MFSRLAFVFLLLFSCAAPLKAKSPELQTATPALWEVQNPSGKGKLLLFGTFHLLPKSIQWQSALFDKKIKSAKKYVFELSDAEMKNPQSQQLLMRKGMLPQGQTLDAIVGPALFAKVDAAGKMVGVPADVLNRMRPWMASVLLGLQAAQAAGMEPGLGVEAVLQARAAKAKLPVMGLETMADQVDALAALDDDGARQMLEETANELANANKLFADMLAAWASGDSAKIESVFLSDMQSYPKAYDALLKQRNLRWLPKLEALLAQRTSMLVAVGAGHLVGPDGVVALLRAKGYRVTQVQPTPTN